MRKLRCGNCGSRNVVLKNAIGRDFSYKDKILILTSDYYMNICSECDNLIILLGEAKELDKLLEYDYLNHNVSKKHYLRKKNFNLKKKI